MVVGYGESHSVVLQSGTKDDAEVDGGLCQSATSNALFPDYFVALVEVHGPEFLVGEVDDRVVDEAEQVFAVFDDVFFGFFVFFGIFIWDIAAVERER